MKQQEHTRKVAGIDTGKDKLDVAVYGSSERLEVANDGVGHEQLIAWLAARRLGRIGIEASGGYEKAVVAALRLAEVEVVVFQPQQIRHFAGFQLLRAKNDRIDAALIAEATASHQEDREAPDPRLQSFAEALTLIEQITEDIARWKTRLEGCRQAEQRGWIIAQIKSLSRARDIERARLVQQIKGHQDLAQRYRLILSVPGVGLPTALILLIRMPELGRVTREQVAALAGLAPYDHDSGRFRGQRRIAGGRGRVRKALYAAAFPAAQRWNPQLVALYCRLKNKGKEHKKALVACARKLLVMVNAVVSRGTPWITTQQTA